MKTSKLCCLCCLLTLVSCDNLWSEHCIYTGYLRGHIAMADSTLEPRAFRQVYYPQSGQGVGKLDGQWDPYNEEGVAGRKVNIGLYKVLSLLPGDLVIRDSASMTAVTLVSRHAWQAETGLELITPSSRPAASDWGTGDVDIDDTTEVWMTPTLLTQHLRINLYLLNVPDGSDFTPQSLILAGVASEKRLYDRTLTGSFLSLQAEFHSQSETLYRSDMQLLGTAGAPDHTLQIACTAGGKRYIYDFDLAEELNNWVSPYREINLGLKVGDQLELVEISLLGWIDKENGDIPLLNE